jgi:hypothetical protein
VAGIDSELTIDTATITSIRANHIGATIEVRQQGTYALSEALVLTTID